MIFIFFFFWEKFKDLFQFNSCHINLKVSDIQPVPDVRVWLFLLPLLHLEPHPLQPDELQVQEGLQGRPPLCPPTKSKGEPQNPFAQSSTCFVTDDLCDEHE